MKNQILYLILFIVLCFCSLQAQVTQEWVARYNGPGNSDDRANSLAVDASGNVYVTGFSAGSGTGEDYITIKYNSSGDLLWVARYNGTGNSNDRAYSLAVDGLGNVYVTGYSVGSGTGDDYTTIKYNSSGDSLWVARYTGPGNNFDRAYSLAIDVSGNVYVTGYSYDSGKYSDYATIKYNSKGDSLWVSRYNNGGSPASLTVSLTVDGSGNVYVTGSVIDTFRGCCVSYATIKYNSSGIELWVQIYNEDPNDIAHSIAVDDSGNVYVTGESGSDYTTVKYNSSGDSLWAARYNGPGNGGDIAYSLAVDSLGNVYVTGISRGIVSYNYATIKYNSSGVQQWVQRYTNHEWINEYPSIAVDGSGNVYVTGIDDSDYVTIKYDPSGDRQWVQSYNGPAGSIDIANSIAVYGSGNVYITGQSTGSGTGIDYATIKYSQSTGISQISNSIPEKFSLSQNYPNPFNPTTNLEFGISKLGFVSLKIYDMLGKEVTTLVNDDLNPGTYKYNFDASGLTSGVYFYKLMTDNFTETKMMMLIK